MQCKHHRLGPNCKQQTFNSSCRVPTLLCVALCCVTETHKYHWHVPSFHATLEQALRTCSITWSCAGVVRRTSHPGARRPFFLMTEPSAGDTAPNQQSRRAHEFNRIARNEPVPQVGMVWLCGVCVVTDVGEPPVKKGNQVHLSFSAVFGLAFLLHTTCEELS